MLLLAFEHLGEAKPFLEHFRAKKSYGIFFVKDIAIYVNYGKGGLSLALNLARLSEQLKPQLCVLFGLAGNLSNLNIGEIVVVNKVKLLDTSLNPVLNPIEINSINGFKNVDCLSVLGNYAFGKDLSLFADCIDMEAYFFAKALNELNLKGFIIKLISDNNSPFLKETEFDYSKAIKVIDLLKQIANNNLTEIFVNTLISDLNILFGLKKLFEKKHYTFTMRQNVYKKIKINTSQNTKKPFKLRYILCEKSLNLKCDKKMDDYASYFHNLKDKCALIYARKKGEFLRRTPKSYTPTNTYGYSIIQSYNCIYDCSYCFLKGYFKTFNPVIFKNIEDYFEAIKKTIKDDKLRPLYFYLGTFSDPLALSVFDSSYIEFARFFEVLDAILEIRTKSVLVDKLLKEKSFKNTVIAYSLAPQSIIDKFEHYTPSLARRLNAIKLLDQAGFNIGIRFDPFFANHISDYKVFIGILSTIKHLHSIEIGLLRFSKNEYKAFLAKNPHILSNLTLKDSMYVQSSTNNIKTLINDLFYNFKDKIYYNMII
jgi:spore photoproduct lyase